jgi:hypothetical protein
VSPLADYITIGDRDREGEIEMERGDRDWEGR